MLGKLIKHEWKGTYRVGCLMMLLMAGITFFGWLAFQSPMWKELSGDSDSYSVTTEADRCSSPCRRRRSTIWAGFM
mgnify:CR=1 FL=1